LRIRKLEIVGFKSFKDRTVIHFDAGITGVVGPNGCGKSNIVDALVWVMGEQSAKHLRGSSMEDVIFGGAEGYAPAGLAEVTLTLENDGGPFPAKFANFTEISVTRRLHRSGESEYLINREQSRLRDIQEIFMDTGAGSKGFSIIEQGAIGKIITAKPEERRTLIEEAAGITKFKARKRESQRKLVATDQNLVRLNDIIGEQKRQLDSLQRQAKRAERYRELKTKIEDLDLWLSSVKYSGLHEEYEESNKTFEEAKEAEAIARAELEQMDSGSEQQRLSVLEKEKAVEEVQTRHGEATEKVQNKEKEIQKLEFEVEQGRRSAVMQGDVQAEALTRKDALQEDHDKLSGELKAAEEEFEKIDGTYQEKKQEFDRAQHLVANFDQELAEKRQALTSAGERVTQIKSGIEAQSLREEDLTVRLGEEKELLMELEKAASETSKNCEELSTELEGEQQLQLSLMGDVESFEQNRDQLLTKQTELKTQVEEFKDNLNVVASRLYGLENLHASFEGFEEGVKNVMLWQKKQKEVHADGSVSEFVPVADVVEVPPEYEMAMEAALGNGLQMLISDSSNQALQAVDYLKTEGSGRSSFYALDENSATRSDIQQPQGEGVRGALKEIISTPDKYKQAVTVLLDKVAIVENIRAALRMRPNYPGWTFVTMEGDTLTADGVITGGASDSAESGVLKRRREMKELSQQKDEWAGKLSLAQVSLQKIDEQLERMQKDLEDAKTKKNEREIALAEKKRDLQNSQREKENAQRALDKQIQEVDELESSLLTTQEKITEFNRELEELENSKVVLEREIEDLAVEHNQARDGFDQLRETAQSLQVESASRKQEVEGLRRQFEMVDSSLADVKQQLDRMEDEAVRNSEALTDNQESLEQAKIDLNALMDQAQVTEKELSEIKNEYEKVAADIREIEEKSSDKRRLANELQAKMNEAQLKAEQAKMKETYLVDQMAEKYMVKLAEIYTEYKDREGNTEEAESELEEYREKIKRIGEVNLSAISEYDDLIGRYEFLVGQRDDLVASKEQLRKVIERINRICSKRFKETFEAVNERFSAVFPVLFDGGQSNLILVDNEDRSEMGIDIMARPPGKKLQNVSLLSGGEKALTAVALVFAIFLVKPSPYCLLDEVDAPLDDANVKRFNDLVREMAKRSQIILVTHNKYTMEINEKLYGVTMQESGVSKMVSVSLSEAQAVVGH
jgi:chromosome segregation protein